MPHLYKNVIGLIGVFLTLCGFIFIGFKLYKYEVVSVFFKYNPLGWLFITVLAVIYGLSCIILALAWRHILAGLGVKVSLRWAIKTYAYSQIARYIPGNIFQFIGRQALGMADGIPGWSLAKSSFLELGLISIAGGLFVTLILPLFSNELSVYISIGLFIISLAFIFLCIYLFLNKNLIYAFFLYVTFLLLSGMLFFSLFIVNESDFSFMAVGWGGIICGAYVVAWLVGLAIPGSPAGIGIRESVLFFLLNDFISDASLLSIIFLGRLITIFGDVIFYLIILTWPFKKGVNDALLL